MNVMAFEQELDVYLRARFTLIVLVTTEEERALQSVKSVCEKLKRPCLTWDVADGFQSLAGGGAAPSAKDPISALDQIDKADGETLFVLKDFHDCWGNAQFKRKLRSVAQRLKFTKKSILVTTPTSKFPEELKDEAVVVEFAPPTTAELEAVLNQLTQTPGVKVNLTKLGREKLVQAALGLTASQAQRVFAKAIVSNGALDDRDIDLVTQEKKEIIRESEALEFYAVTETPDDVGGLGVLKEWLRLRESAFTQEARDYGLPAPKGIALIGIPGTGKSLTAKMIGGLWRLPLLRLDVGSLFGSLVGEAEERTRRALRLAETVAPCVAGNTRVTLADGSEQTIESLYQQSPENLSVLGMDEQFQLQLIHVHAITCRSAPDLYYVQLAHASLRATSNHLHPVLRDGQSKWVRTDELTDEDHIAIPRKIPTSTEYPAMIEFLPENTRLYMAGALSFARPEIRTPQRRFAVRFRGSDYVKVKELADPDLRPSFTAIRHFRLGHGGTSDSKLPKLPDRLNDEIGYLLGLITSDGYLGRLRIGFINTEIALHERFAEILQQQFLIRPSFGRQAEARLLPGTSERSIFKKCYFSYVDCLLLRQILSRIHGQLLRLPAAFLRAWLRGHFDGDGSITAVDSDPKVTITAKVPEVNRLLRSALHRVGFPTTNLDSANIEITGLENVLRFIEQIGSSHPAKRLRMEAWQRQSQVESKDRTDVIPVGARLRAVRQQLGMGSHHFQSTRSSLISAYERNKIHPSRRRLCSILSEMKAWAKLHQRSADPLDEIQLLVDANVMWSRVLSVKSEAPAEPVYDLVCEEPHTFIANGIITHNCIVWIDEMEKALAHGGGDSGTSTRVFGAILTWMQEKKAPCFVIGTANDISSLPPELLRKGRFDEIFFLDLPTLEERREIFSVHLRKRNRLPQDFDVARLAHESQGYVGAEIEQAIIDAMYVGFNARREFTTDDISSAIKRQVPLSVSQRETIEALRNWLREGRAQSGSFQELREAERQFVPLQI
jgi:ATP-dependent 26S proteasome regulatory subunit